MARSIQVQSGKHQEQNIKINQMRVTIGQINTINGDFEANTASIIRAIEQAKAERSDMVVLPETAIQGYTSLDWFRSRRRAVLITTAGKDHRRDRRNRCDRWHSQTVRVDHWPPSVQFRGDHPRSKAGGIRR